MPEVWVQHPAGRRKLRLRHGRLYRRQRLPPPRRPLPALGLRQRRGSSLPAASPRGLLCAVGCFLAQRRQAATTMAVSAATAPPGSQSAERRFGGVTEPAQWRAPAQPPGRSAACPHAGSSSAAGGGS